MLVTFYFFDAKKSPKPLYAWKIIQTKLSRGENALLRGFKPLQQMCSWSVRIEVEFYFSCYKDKLYSSINKEATQNNYKRKFFKLQNEVPESSFIRNTPIASTYNKAYGGSCE